MDPTLDDQLKTMIVERLFMKIDPADIESDKSLIEVYGVDSVSLLELVVGLEETFGIEVDDDDFDVEHFKSVTALAAFIRARTDAAPPE